LTSAIGVNITDSLCRHRVRTISST